MAAMPVRLVMLLCLSSLGLGAAAAAAAAGAAAAATAAAAAAAAAATAAPGVALCPAGWIDDEELGCFMFLDQSVGLSWIEAQQECEALGGYLAEPTDRRKAEFLYGIGVIFGAVSSIDYWWIGLSDLGNEGHWIWSASGANIGESFWGPNKPNTENSNTDDCTVMVVNTNGFWWEDTSCLTAEVQQNRVAPICQRDRLHEVVPATTTSTTSSMATTEGSHCNAGWTSFNGHCYLLVTGSFHTWQDAEYDCMSRGGHLASVHSQAEEDFITGLGLPLSMWIGGSDRASEGHWVWSDGSEWIWGDWALGEPNGGILENCLFLMFNTWHDGGCNSALHYLCKI